MLFFSQLLSRVVFFLPDLNKGLLCLLWTHVTWFIVKFCFSPLSSLLQCRTCIGESVSWKLREREREILRIMVACHQSCHTHARFALTLCGLSRQHSNSWKFTSQTVNLGWEVDGRCRMTSYNWSCHTWIPMMLQSIEIGGTAVQWWSIHSSFLEWLDMP